MDGAHLAPVDLFSSFTVDERQKIADCMNAEAHPRGAVLVEEGDLPTKFFVLLDGHVTVHRHGRHVADLGPGDYFGEVGVLSLEPRNASVIATTPVEVAVTMGWELRNVLSGSPELRATLESATRTRGSN